MLPLANLRRGPREGARLEALVDRGALVVLRVILRGEVVRGALAALPGLLVVQGVLVAHLGRLAVPVVHRHLHPILVGCPRKGAPILVVVVVVGAVIQEVEDSARPL